jgi:LysM repeat protein
MFLRSFIRLFSICVILSLMAACTTTPTASSTPQPKILTPYQTDTPSPTPAFVQEVTPQIIFTPTPTPLVYKVRKDELGSSIALRYGITLQMLQSSNPGVDLNFLKEGQDLIIPPKQQTPAPNLTSPTPAILSIKDIECYPAADKAGWCIGTIYNDQPDGVMYITGEFVLNGNGQSWQKSFTSLLDTLPAGKYIPVYAWFDPPFPYPYQVNITIDSALRQSPEMQKTNTPEIMTPVIDILPGGLSARITGMVSIKGKVPGTIAIVAAGYSNNRPAGIRRIEFTSGYSTGKPMPFTVWLYSIGPAMDRVELFIEAE